MSTESEALCRLCAAPSHVNVLGVIENEDSELCEQLRITCQVDIRLSDPLPKYVCRECEGTMRTFYLFYTKVRRAQETLESMLNKNQENETLATVDSDDDEFILEIKQEEFLDLDSGNEGEEVPDLQPPFSSMKRAQTRSFPSEDEGNCDESRMDYADQNKDSQESISLRESNYLAVTSSQIEDSGKGSDSEVMPPSRPLELYLRTLRSEQCPQAFNYQRVLSAHLERYSNAASNPHSSKTLAGSKSEISCCGRKFTQFQTLYRHMCDQHPDKSLFKCSICNTSFQRRCQLIEHIKAHIPNYSLKCTICDKFFHNKSNWNRHMKYH